MQTLVIIAVGLLKSSVIAVLLLICMVYTLVFEKKISRRVGKLSSGDFISHLISSRLACLFPEYCFALASSECNVFSSVSYNSKQLLDICLQNKSIGISEMDFSVHFAFLRK